MFSRTERNANEERLDEVGEDLVRAARASADEIEAGAGGPLLYTRIRASIAERQKESEGFAGGWLNLLQAAKFAVPAMALATASVTCLPRLGLYSREHPRAQRVEIAQQHTYNSPAEPVGPGDLGPVTISAGACALSNTQECAISNNEVLAVLFADENQETQR